MKNYNQGRYLTQVGAFIAREVLLEWRQPYAVSGMLLYLVSTIFVCYLTFQGVIGKETWNALFWIILLFASVNAILKGFSQEPEGRMLYYYTITTPSVLITAKMIYHALMMVLLSGVGLIIFIAFMGQEIHSLTLFLANMFLGVIGFACIMSLVSAIASKAKNHFTLMAVLSFPLVLPLFVVLIRVSSAALSGAQPGDHLGDLLVLMLLAFITFVLSNLLFPFVWKE